MNPIDCVGSAFGEVHKWWDCVAKEAIVGVSKTFFQKDLARIVLPLDQTVKYPEYERSRVYVEARLKGQTVSITTLDDIKLDAVWSDSGNKEAPTAIVFHGNACTLNAFVDHAKWYRDREFNVLLITMRGYPGSEGSSITSGEIGLYLDAEAAVRYAVETKGVDREKVIAHGYSLGGALATAAGYFFGTYVTLDHAFTSPGAVAIGSADKIARNISAKMRENPILSSIEIKVPSGIPEGLMEGAFPIGNTYDIPEEKQLKGSRPLVTDGLNNLEKIKKLDKEFFVFFGTRDHLMPTSFANEFYEAKFGPVPPETEPEARRLYLLSRQNHLAELSGGGHSDGDFWYYQGLSEKYENFLRTINLLS